MYRLGEKPLRGFGTRWIDHQVRAMGRLVETFGLNVSHLKDVISKTTKSKDRETLQGKLSQLIDAKVMLRCAFFRDIRFSLITQEKNVNVVKILDVVESTKSNYERLRKKE